MPPFFAVLFYVSFFIRLAGEIKSKKAGFAVYSAAIVLAAVLMEFFSTFSAGADPVLFMAPFYFVMVLYGVSGAMDISSFMQQKKIPGFSASGIFYGLMALLLIVNLLFLFNKSVERNNAIKNISGSPYVDKFIER
jgi:hypothetical protein